MNLLTFTTDEDIILLDGKQMCPLLQWETLFLSSKAVCNTKILEKVDSLEQKLLVPLLTRHTEIRQFHGEVSPKIFLYLPLIIQNIALSKVTSNFLIA